MENLYRAQLCLPVHEQLLDLHVTFLLPQIIGIELDTSATDIEVQRVDVPSTTRMNPLRHLNLILSVLLMKSLRISQPYEVKKCEVPSACI